MTITDVNGKYLIHQNEISGNDQINVSSLSNGVYFVRITNASGVTKVNKLIKQ